MTVIPAEAFRSVLGHLPTGVTVLSAFAGGGTPIGMAANSVTSVSLDPPLILVCPAKTSETWPRIRAAGRFCVSFMASHHEALCRRFATKGVQRFEGVPWHPVPAGPALDDAVAWLECDIAEEHDAGDHTVVIASVTAIRSAEEGTPLVFFRGQYGTFSTGNSL